MRGYRPSFWSWCFPASITALSVYLLIRMHYLGIGLGSASPVGWSFIAAIVFGGALSLALTFLFRAELRDHFLPRLIILLSAVAVNALAGEFGLMPRGGYILLYAADAAFTALYFFRIQRTGFREWLVIFLSTPALYMMLYHILLIQEIPDLIPIAD